MVLEVTKVPSYAALRARAVSPLGGTHASTRDHPGCGARFGAAEPTDPFGKERPDRGGTRKLGAAGMPKIQGARRAVGALVGAADQGEGAVCPRG